MAGANDNISGNHYKFVGHCYGRGDPRPHNGNINFGLLQTMPHLNKRDHGDLIRMLFQWSKRPAALQKLFIKKYNKRILILIGEILWLGLKFSFFLFWLQNVHKNEKYRNFYFMNFFRTWNIFFKICKVFRHFYKIFLMSWKNTIKCFEDLDILIKFFQNLKVSSNFLENLDIFAKFSLTKVFLKTFQFVQKLFRWARIFRGKFNQIFSNISKILSNFFQYFENSVKFLPIFFFKILRVLSNFLIKFDIFVEFFSNF